MFMHPRAKWIECIQAIVLCLAAISFAGTALASEIGFAKTADPGAAAASAGVAGYHWIKTIAVPGNTFWDYLKYDPATHRLFISRGDHVDVVNVRSGKVAGNMGGMKRIHGIVLAPEFNRGFVTDGGAAKVWIFNLKTLKVIGSAPAAPDADGEVYDPVSKRVFTMNGDSKSSTVVDAATGKVVGTIALGGQPEFPVADGRGHVYANLESTSELIEIDAHTLKITHRWPVAPGEHPSGLAMDTAHRILFSGCSNKMMAIVNADTGKLIAAPPIGQGVDATRFDPGTQDAFASNGDGTLTVIHEDSPEKFHVVENVKTELGARTMALDPTTHDVFLVTSKLITIKNPPPHTRHHRMVPGTLHVLVYGRG
jgi:YVTN family beta-propeller protein